MMEPVNTVPADVSHQAFSSIVDLVRHQPAMRSEHTALAFLFSSRHATILEWMGKFPPKTAQYRLLPVNAFSSACESKWIAPVLNPGKVACLYHASESISPTRSAIRHLVRQHLQYALSIRCIS